MPWLLAFQVISSYGIDYVGSMVPCVVWIMFSMTGAFLMPRNDDKCKYIFLRFLTKNRPTTKGLRNEDNLQLVCITSHIIIIPSPKQTIHGISEGIETIELFHWGDMVIAYHLRCDSDSLSQVWFKLEKSQMKTKIRFYHKSVTMHHTTIYQCLTHCGLVMPYGHMELGKNWPDVTEPLPELVLTHHQRCSVAFTWGHFTGNAHDT